MKSRAWRTKHLPPLELDPENGYPFADCILVFSISGRYRSWLIPRCPLCGAGHFHGAGEPRDGQDPRYYLHHKAPHCIDPIRAIPGKSGYILRETIPGADAVPFPKNWR